LIPIGGFKTIGYMEVIINPAFNLIEIANLTQKPLTIYNMKGEKINYYSPINDVNKLMLEEIEYTLIGDDNKNALHMVLLDNISAFNQDMEITRIVAIISFIFLTIIAILIALFLMNLFLFEPIQHMIQQMRRVADGELSIEVDNRGLKDFHELALNFNTMREMVDASIQKLEHMSLMDCLTGIGNRRLFDQTLNNEWRNYKRNGKPLSLVICDIDFFKQFNDLYGHQKGDECIQQVAKVIFNAIYRPSDIVCRYGGEEFTLILPDTPLEGALYITELVRQLIDQLEIPNKNSLVSDFITLSMGVATVPLEDIDSEEELIKAADTALYIAKENGRNQVRSAKA
jgi:diguanylate cyclase (GGDEF)-like protein